MTWSLATYQRGEFIGVAALREDGTLVAPPDLKRWTSMLELLADWAQAEDILRAIEIDDAPVIDRDSLTQVRIAIDELGDELERRLGLPWRSPKS